MRCRGAESCTSNSGLEAMRCWLLQRSLRQNLQFAWQKRGRNLLPNKKRIASRSAEKLGAAKETLLPSRKRRWTLKPAALEKQKTPTLVAVVEQKEVQTSRPNLRTRPSVLIHCNQKTRDSRVGKIPNSINKTPFRCGKMNSAS